MDMKEVHLILQQEEAKAKRLSYSDYIEWVKTRKFVDAFVKGQSGVQYEIARTATWDDESLGSIRVTIALHDPKDAKSARRPEIADFIIAPDGSFLGE